MTRSSVTGTDNISLLFIAFAKAPEPIQCLLLVPSTRVKRPGDEFIHPPPSTAILRVKEICLHSSPVVIACSEKTLVYFRQTLSTKHMKAYSAAEKRRQSREIMAKIE